MAASGLTFLQIINRVLARMREDSVAAHDTTTYSTLIGTFVNAVKAEIEDAYHWPSLRDTYSVSTTPATSAYSLTSSGMNAVIKSAWDSTTGRKLTKGTNTKFDERFFGVGSNAVQTGAPTEYIPAGFDVNLDLTVEVWPVPTSTNVLKFNVYRPQADYSASADVPLIPQTVLIEGAVAMAMAERGDEGGTAIQKQEAFYRDLLASAVTRAQAEDESETDWLAE